jgi:hypothetical protein
MGEEKRRWIRITAIAVAAVGVASAVAAWVVQDQIRRHQRNLFHESPIRRMAALEHLSRQRGSVDLLNLLRDYIAWEPRTLLRNRATALQDRMADEVAGDAAQNLPAGESLA